MLGTLLIKPQFARLTHDTALFNRMDPYCLIKIGSQTQSTSACKNGGKNPKWGLASLSFHVTSEEVINIEVWDKDLIAKNELIAQGSISLALIISNPNNPSPIIPLFYKGKSAGDICIQFEWHADLASVNQLGAPGFQQPAPVYQQLAPVYQQPEPAYEDQQPAPGYQQEI